MKNLTASLAALCFLLFVSSCGNDGPSQEEVAEARHAAEQVAEEERLAAEKAAEVERLAAEKAAEEERLAAEKASFDQVVAIFAEHGIHGSGVDDMIKSKVGYKGISGYIQPVAESEGSRWGDGEAITFDLSPEVPAKYIGKIVEFRADYESRGFFETTPNLANFTVVQVLDPGDYKVHKCFYRPCNGKGTYKSTGKDTIKGTCELCKKEEGVKRRDSGFEYLYCQRCANKLNMGSMSAVLMKEQTTQVTCGDCGGTGTIVGHVNQEK